MKKITLYLSSLLLLLIILSSCGSSNNSSQDVFQYRGSYLGDNSAVGNIITQLPQNKAFKQVTLQTNKKPFGMVIEYGNVSGDIKNSVINNATYLFCLVKNADWITFDYPNQKYTLTRQLLQQWDGKDLNKITNEKELKKLIQNNLSNKNKLTEFIKK
jgi:hypothetical protein